MIRQVCALPHHAPLPMEGHLTGAPLQTGKICQDDVFLVSLRSSLAHAWAIETT